MEYPQYFAYVLNSAGRKGGWQKSWSYIDTPGVKNAFYVLRVLFPLVGFIFSVRVFNALVHNKPLILKREDKLYDHIVVALHNNYSYCKNLAKDVKLLLLLLLTIQLALLLYFLFATPYHYDEALSYIAFSGNGWLADMLYYPVPNNHIFYNMVASTFLLLPIDAVTAIRLPNIIISFFSTYYLYKAAAHLTGKRYAIIACTLCVFSFQFIIYSVQARGYGFIIFFVIAAIYSFIKIVSKEDVRKYLGIYGISAVLGLFTIPTFLYFLVPASAILLIFFMMNAREYKLSSFIRVHIFIGLSTFLLYLPLILVNGADVFKKAQAAGVTSPDNVYNKANLIKHLQETWSYLVSGYSVSMLLLLVIAFIWFISVFRKGSSYTFISLLMLVILISPLPIIVLQKAIPFPRNWSYLLVPLSLAGSVAAYLLGTYTKALNVMKHSSFIAGFTVIFSALLFAKIFSHYRGIYDMDYRVQSYVAILKDKMPYLKNIQRTNDLSFYLADDIQFEAIRHNQDINVNTLNENDSLKADLVITVPGSNLQATSNYRLIPNENPFFTVYIRKDL